MNVRDVNANNESLFKWMQETHNANNKFLFKWM